MRRGWHILVHCALSQFRPVTDGRTDGQLCDMKDHVHTMQRGKNPLMCPTEQSDRIQMKRLLVSSRLSSLLIVVARGTWQIVSRLTYVAA